MHRVRCKRMQSPVLNLSRCNSVLPVVFIIVGAPKKIFHALRWAKCLGPPIQIGSGHWKKYNTWPCSSYDKWDRQQPLDEFHLSQSLLLDAPSAQLMIHKGIKTMCSGTMCLPWAVSVWHSGSADHHECWNETQKSGLNVKENVLMIVYKSWSFAPWKAFIKKQTGSENMSSEFLHCIFSLSDITVKVKFG